MNYRIFGGVLLLILVVGCTSETITGNMVDVTGSELIVGATLILSGGEMDREGNAMREGIELAVAEHNAQSDNKVKVIFEDSHFDMKQATNSAKKLIEVDQVDAVMFSTHTETVAVGPLFEEARIPAISLWDSNAEIDNLGDYVFGMGLYAESAAIAMAEYAEKLGIKEIAIVAHHNPWCYMVVDSFIELFEAAGGTVLMKEYLNEDQTDFRTVLLKASQAEAIYAPITVHLENFFQQAMEIGYDGHMMSADVVTDQVIRNLGAAAEGLLYTGFHVPQSEEVELFKARYAAYFGKETDMVLHNVLGYDGMKMILAAATEGANPESIKEALYRVTTPGAFGELIDINEDGSYHRHESVLEVVNGESIKVHP